jgi:hypothetical protein
MRSALAPTRSLTALVMIVLVGPASCAVEHVASAPTGLAGKLGPAQKPAPATFAALLLEVNTKSPSPAGLRAVVEPYVGAKVRWRLRSWGGEESGDGFVTPNGHLAPTGRGKGPGRIRFVSLELGEKADLGTVDDAGQPVVTCLARFTDNGDNFVRSDGKQALASATGPVTVEATVWGVTDEGRGGNLWLHDCAIAGAE